MRTLIYLFWIVNLKIVPALRCSDIDYYLEHINSGPGSGLTTKTPETTTEQTWCTSSPTSYTCDSQLSEFLCTKEGSFPDYSDPQCAGYYHCTQEKDGFFLQAYSTCESSPFSPKTLTCSPDFACPCNSTTNTTPKVIEITTNSAIVPPCYATYDYEKFECAEVGRFADLSDFSCREYFLCSKLRNGSYVKTPYACQNSFFDRETARCSSNYTCPCNNPEVTTAFTPAPCFSSNGDDEFTCTSVGRFPDFADFSCAKYFLCSKLRNGTFVKTEYKCQSSFFDREKERCTSSYVCPCNSQTATTLITSSATENTSLNPTTLITTGSYPCSPSKEGEKFECTSVGRFPDFSDFSCARYFLCSKLRNGTFIRTEYTCQNSFFDRDTERCSNTFVCPCDSSTITIPIITETTTDHLQTTTFSETATSTQTSCIFNPNEFDEFICSSGGRFPNLGDPSCKEYILCSKLRNGTFVKTPYKCQNSFFDRENGKCSSIYFCPCNPSTTSLTTPEITTELPTSTTIFTTTSEIVTSTQNLCISNPEWFEQFSCQSDGRFANLGDFSCTEYILCSKLRYGTFVKTPYKCQGSFFDRENGKCSSIYSCPCNPSTISSTTPEITTELSKSTVFTTSSEIVTPTQNLCIINPKAFDEFICLSGGRFPNLGDPSCKEYILCSKLRNGTFVKTPYKCQGSFFDRENGKCSSIYSCPCNPSTILPTTSEITTEPPISTTIFTTSSEILTPTQNLCVSNPEWFEQFICESSGRFANLGDLSCTKYVLCSKLRNGTFVKTPYKCQGSFFDRESGKCTSIYSCPCNPLTTSSTTSETTSDLPKSTTIFTTSSEIVTTTQNLCVSNPEWFDEFICESSGRFANLGDLSCTKYVLCSKLRNGTFVKTAYKCQGSFFDRENGKCSSIYSCPCNPPTSSSTTPETTSELPKSTTIFTTSSEIVTTTQNLCVSNPEWFDQFICPSGGRFPNLGDPSCTEYILCSKLRNGTFIKTPYKCQDSFFDRENGRCSSLYSCPCNPSTTSSTNFEMTTEHIQTTPVIKTSTETPTPTQHSCVSNPEQFDEFICSSVGRFPNLGDPSCTKYILCSKLRNGTFIKTPYKCQNAFFDRENVRCSSTYICPCNPSTTTPITTEGIKSTTSAETSTPTLSSCTSNRNEFEEFICPSGGRFPNLGDSSCTNYILCSKLYNGSFVKTSYKCQNSLFDRETLRCSFSYKCPCNNSSELTTTLITTPSVALTTTLECTFSRKEFICRKKGRFPDLSDETCSRYFLCSQLANGTFIKSSYSCGRSFFNPVLGKCSLDYACICVNNNSTTDVATKGTEVTTEPTVTTPTSSYKCHQPLEEPPEFQCAAIGRFPDFYDHRCKRYFLCSQLQNGTFIKTPYNCPGDSCINETTEKCTSECDCPCNEALYSL